jgi:hypothetical protein
MHEGETTRNKYQKEVLARLRRDVGEVSARAE